MDSLNLSMHARYEQVTSLIGKIRNKKWAYPWPSTAELSLYR